MLPLFALYFMWLLWLLWLVVWMVATVAPLRGVHKLYLPEELLYRIVTLAAGALLFTLTPWPGLDVQYRLWHRAVDDDLAWRLVLTVGVSLGIAGWALLHRHIAFSRGANIVTDGPYWIVRHPIYLSLILAVFATATLFGRPSSFAGASLFTLAFVTKVVLEEWRTQGPAFAAYKRRALMFVPLLGFAWFFLITRGQRLRQTLARSEPLTPLPIPVAPARALPPSPALPPTAKRSGEDFAPPSRVRSVKFELILEDETGVGA